MRLSILCGCISAVSALSRGDENNLPKPPANDGTNIHKEIKSQIHFVFCFFYAVKIVCFVHFVFPTFASGTEKKDQPKVPKKPWESSSAVQKRGSQDSWARVLESL